MMMKEKNTRTKITFIQEETTKKIRRSDLSGFQQPIYFAMHGGVKQGVGCEAEAEMSINTLTFEFA